MRLHILGVPHTKTTDEFTTCAFTMKVRNLCKMMHARGHEVFHYGAEGSNPECAEHVSVVTAEEWNALYKHPGTGFYDLATDGRYASFHAKWALNAKKAMLARMGPHEYGDIICLTWGGTQRAAADGVPQCHVESGIGYPHSWANYRVYESYAWMHMHLGRENVFGGGKWYWAVIPNAFDIGMFDYNPAPPESRGDELLYIGRLNNDKGVSLACDAAREAGLKLLLVGQGNPEPFLRGNQHVRYLPPVGVEGRRKLIAGARAVICPTVYVEPFCGVHVEAMLSGTPVITTDWGVFCETVLHGVTGYRCRTMEQFVWAAKNVHKLSPEACRTWAFSNFSLERVALMYEEFFQQVLNLRHRHPNGGGFYLPDPGREQLDWLRRRLPDEASAERIDLTRKHVPTPDPGPETAEQEWDRAQKFERGWWGLDWAPHWDEELKKQLGYFRLMDMPADFDFGDKSILDVGCGPVSLLQRSKHGESRGVDPLAISKETAKRYDDAGVEFINIKAEDMPVDRAFDEVWMYNCFSGETRFWANGQLVRLVDVVGDDVEVLAGGVWRKATVKCFGKQKLQRIVFAPYRAPTDTTYEYIATPNHRWITTNRGEVTDLQVGDRVLSTPLTYDDHHPTYRDGFVHGLVFGDGHRLPGKDRFAIRLCGTKEHAHLEKIQLSRFHTGQSYPPSYNGDPCVLLHAPDVDLKKIPSDSTSLTYQAGFVAGWMAADGSSKPKFGTASLVLWSINKDALDWAAERAPLLGWCVTGRTTGSNMITNFGPRSAPMRSLTLRPEPTEYRVRAIVDEGLEEEVYCVVEPETHTFTLEGGLVTGNCLQHTEDPHAILRKITSMGRAVRIFEWIDIKEKHEGHPQLLNEQMFLDHFGSPDYERLVWNVGNLRDFGGTAINRYVAIHAVRKTPLPVEAAAERAA